MLIWFELNENPSNLLVSNCEVVGQVSIFRTSNEAGTLHRSVRRSELTIIPSALHIECAYYFDYRLFSHHAAHIFCDADWIL